MRLLAPDGTLAEGDPADLTLLDVDAEVTVDRRHFRSMSRSTPFDGWKLRGKPVGTILAGRKVELP